MTPLISIEKPKLVIGEGIDEQRTLDRALPGWGINAQVLPIGGKSKLPEYLNVLRADANFPIVSAIAVLRDADDDPQAAFNSVSSALRGVSLSPPSNHASFSIGHPRIGIFILPDGLRPGMLETLCLDSIAASRLLECVESYLACARSHGAKVATPPDKSRMHAWLSAQDRADLRFGEAASAGAFDFANAAFSRLRAFLALL